MEKQMVHFIGIGGIGMSGLARILLQRGVRVSGSDLRSSPILSLLEKEGALVHIGHSSHHVPTQATVVYSTDIANDNPEVQEALLRKLPLLHRSALLHQLMKESDSLLIAGTHGKTTTTSLLAHILLKAEENPSYCIGGVLQSEQTNAGHGKGRWFVAEADESDGSFLAYDPKGAILTNIDTDHLNHWKTEEKLIEGFSSFQEKVLHKQWLFWCAEDDRLKRLHLPGFSYGFSSEAHLHIQRVLYEGWRSFFTCSFLGRLYENIEIPLIGAHNILNSSAVFGLCLQLGLPEDKIRSGLRSFLGVGRRMEKKGQVGGISIYDDYAHHPSEIQTTLQGVRKACPERRIVVFFQPHRFTRTRDCLDLFGSAFHMADLVFLTDIYAAGEPPIEGIDALKVVGQVLAKGHPGCEYVPKQQLLSKALSTVQEPDIVISMGAGDITALGPQLLQGLSS